MKLLAIDTSTEACSAALSVNGKVFAEFDVCPQQHSQRLLPMVDGLLKQAGLKVTELDYLAFGRGPGSFTGVRIATSMLQGLALGTELPVVGISTLACMAQQVMSQTQSRSVAVAIDARMDEVYFCQYHKHGELAISSDEEKVIAPELVTPLLDKDCQSLAGTGWQAYEALSEFIDKLGEPEVLYPDARYMLPLAIDAIEQGQAVDVEQAQPVYLRDKVTWKKLPGRE